jgi:hypothetical protein
MIRGGGRWGELILAGSPSWTHISRVENARKGGREKGEGGRGCY